VCRVQSLSLVDNILCGTVQRRRRENRAAAAAAAAARSYSTEQTAHADSRVERRVLCQVAHHNHHHHQQQQQQQQTSRLLYKVSVDSRTAITCTYTPGGPKKQKVKVKLGYIINYSAL